MKRWMCAMGIVACSAVAAVVAPVPSGAADGPDGTGTAALADVTVQTRPSTLVVEPVPGREAEMTAALAAGGWQVLREAGGAVEVASTDEPDGSAGRLAVLPGVAIVSPPQPAVETVTVGSQLTAIGSAGVQGGEGARAIGVPIWQAADLTGRGIRLAVIDTGFAEWDRAAAADEVAPLEFDPARDVNACNAGFTRTNHGTATAEIIYDVAPGVELFRACIDDALDLAEVVPQLIAMDVDVVNMSLGFYNTARGDGRGGPGSPDHSVRRAIEAGVLWVNSAGNEALVHHAGPFTDTNGDGRHEWSAGKQSMAFTVPPGGPITIYLKWDDWDRPTNDFALCLTRDPAAEPQCFPRTTPGPLTTPTTALGLRNPDSTAVVIHASIRRVAGSGTPRMDAFFLGADSIEFPVPASSLAEPAAVDGILAVGAVCTATREIRPYSSQGPTLDGRVGVSLAAPGSISGLLFGPANGCEGGYGGTSAAAPHVAGALALLAQGRPGISNETLRGELFRRTSSGEDPGAAGPDPVYGVGVLKLGTPGTSGQPEPPTQPPVGTTFGLGVSDAADRSAARPFDNPTLAGDAYVFLTPVFPRPEPEVVRWFVDGRLVQVEKLAAYDLGGGNAERAYPFDTLRLSDGPHTLEARIRLADGTESVLRAPFRVDNGGRPRPPQPFQLVASADGGATNRPLEGATLAGPARLALLGAAPGPVDRVLLYVDADLVGWADRAPGVLVEGLDVSRLGPGEHMSQAIVYLTDGRIVTVNSTFTV